MRRFSAGLRALRKDVLQLGVVCREIVALFLCHFARAIRNPVAQFHCHHTRDMLNPASDQNLSRPPGMIEESSTATLLGNAQTRRRSAVQDMRLAWARLDIFALRSQASRR